MHEKRGTRWLETELAQVSEELEAVKDLARAAEKRHAEENRPETEAAREGRREEAELVRERRARLVGELNQRAIEGKGWAQDRTEGGEAIPGAGRAGRLRIGPHLLLPERGFVIYDRERATVAWVRKVPTPVRAEELLREHGVPWEGELLSHNLSLAPEEKEE
jgi:hypothetical protein